VTAHGTLDDAGGLLIGDVTGAIGSVSIDGEGSVLNATDSTSAIVIARDDQGSLAVSDHGVLIDAGALYVGTGSGTGEIIVSTSGYVSVAQRIGLNAPPAGSPVLAIMSGGGVEIGGSSGYTADALVIDPSGSLVGTGTIDSDFTPTLPVLSRLSGST